jgi:hypothetical protein
VLNQFMFSVLLFTHSFLLEGHTDVPPFLVFVLCVLRPILHLFRSILGVAPG